ncbi:amidase [Roseibium sp.]|uniref:amidase n=1 Tax=Roseibium sp. TaxID=1936156 RepID=UPI003A984D74
MTRTNPIELTASEAARKIRAGLLTSTELVKACLARIDETDGQLKAWAHVDAERALAQAADADAMRQAGRPLGALHGVPVGLKDIIDTKDAPTERGSAIFKGRKPGEDAVVVQRLLEAGTVILGKTKTTELAFVHATDTVNPHNADRTPGGSSSGSAAAVAAYQVPLALGTQTNGSVIRPASFCGTYGFKPTRGIISRTGVLQTSVSLDQIGVFARSAEDVAALGDALNGYDQRDAMSYPRPRPRILEGYISEPPVEPVLAWIDLPFADRLSEASKAGFEELLDSLGGRVERIEAHPSLAQMVDTQRIIHEYEICLHLKQTFDEHWGDISSTLQPIVERGRTISTAQYEDALGQMKSAEEFFSAFLKDYDAILTPSAAGEAPALGPTTGDPIFCTLWTLAGLPCLSMPLMVGETGLPIGVQLVGAQEQDDRLLRTSRWLLSRLQAETAS